MIRATRNALEAADQHLQSLSVVRITLTLTALVLVLHPPPLNVAAKLLLPVVCVVLLLFPKMLLKPWPWFLALAALVTSFVVAWFGLDNHQFLITYWVLACVLAVQAQDTEDILSWNARWLIGLVFFFATLTKILWGDFSSGDFFHYRFLVDSRLEHAAMLFGGLQLEDLQRNREILHLLMASPPDLEASLTTSDRLQWAARALSIAVLFIEAALAVSFLVPRPKWLYERRDLILIGFFITTYPFAPVKGFAAILMVLGLAQCPPERTKTRLAYVLFFVAIPIFVGLPTHLPRLESFLLGQP